MKISNYSRSTKVLSIAFLAGNFFCLSALSATEGLNPYVPHVYLNGYGGDGAGNFLGRADLLAPLYTTNDRNLFIYGQGMYGDQFDSDLSNVWSASAGLGYRQIFGSRLYGAYVLTDYNSTPNDNQYWMISPGIETLGEIIDFRANGYFPVGDAKWTHDKDPVYIGHTTDHDLYEVDSNTESVGPGGDAEIGAKIFSIKHMPVKVFLNGYYFAPEDQDEILGIGGRITLQPTRYLTLEVRDSYDNENHNVIMAGVRLYLNGFAYGLKNTQVDDIGIQPRLYDQIERNLEAAGVGTPAMSASNNVSKTVESDYYTVYVTNDDGAVPEADGVTGSGTLDDPYIYTNNSDMQTILDDTEGKYGTDPVRIYFTAPNDAPYYMTPAPTYVTPYSNQSLWGTTGDNWDIPTTPDTYAVDFIGGFSLDDVSGVEFHYVALENITSGFSTAMVINNSQNTLLQSVQIGGNGGISYETGISMENDSLTTFDDAKIYGTSSGILILDDNGDLVLKKNTLIQGNTDGIVAAPQIDGGDVTLGNIVGDGTSQVVGASYGLIVTGNKDVSIIQQADAITIGNITGIEFIGETAGLSSYAGSSLVVGDISDSKFSGEYGFSAGSSTGTTTIGNINNSWFTGGSAGFGVTSQSGYDVTIGDINSSNFSASRSSGAGFIAQTIGGNLTMGNINNSEFQGAAAFSADLYATTSTGNLIIKNIVHSDFFATSINVSAGFNATANNVSIGNIVDSIFYASSPDSYGFAVVADNTAVIGDVTGSEFSGSEYAFAETGLIVTTGKIQNSAFDSTGTGIYLGDINTSAGVVTVDGNSVTTGEELYDLLSSDNTFNTTIYKTSVNGDSF